MFRNCYSHAKKLGGIRAGGVKGGKVTPHSLQGRRGGPITTLELVPVSADVPSHGVDACFHLWSIQYRTFLADVC